MLARLTVEQHEAVFYTLVFAIVLASTQLSLDIWKRSYRRRAARGLRQSLRLYRSPDTKPL